MPCASFGVSQVLVGLYRVGIVGLKEAFEQAEASGVDEPARLLDLMLARLRQDNYVPEAMAAPYRRAVWREYLRRRGEDFSAFLSEVEVTVRGRGGEERERFVELLRSVLVELELAPLLRCEPAGAGEPEAAVGDHTVIRSGPTREALKLAVRKSISDW